MRQTSSSSGVSTWTPWQSQALVIAVSAAAGLIVIGSALGLGLGIGLNNDGENLTPVEATITTSVINTTTTTNTTSTSATTTTTRTTRTTMTTRTTTTTTTRTTTSSTTKTTTTARTTTTTTARTTTTTTARTTTATTTTIITDASTIITDSTAIMTDSTTIMTDSTTIMTDSTTTTTVSSNDTIAQVDSCFDDGDIKGIAKSKDTVLLANDASTPLLYHGGPVMTNPVIYIIWYGNWTDNNGTIIVENFVYGLGSTEWWNITVQYNNTTPIFYGGSITDDYSQGTFLTTNLVFASVQNAINNGDLSNDTNGIYFVLTSADCNEELFCTRACGWHTYDPSSNLKFVWVGNAEEICPNSCRVRSVSPNGNPGADAMVSVIAHEAVETATDPYLNAWYGTNCADESADKCANDFGETSTLSNGAEYNIVVNGLDYLIQENWRIDTQDCGLS